MWVSSVFCAILLPFVANGANILGIFMTPSYSHQIVFQPIWKELSLRGHQVTVYTPSPLNDPSLTNLTEYDLGFSYPYMRDLEKGGYDVSEIFKTFHKVSEAQLNHPYMQDLLKKANNESYDLLLVEYLWSPYYAFKEIYNIPMIGITSLPLTVQGSDALGMEKHQIVDPDLLLQFPHAESFKQRVMSWSFNWIYRLILNFKLGPVLNRQVKKYFKNVKKDTYSLAKETSLVLGNYNLVLQNNKLLSSKFIPISGIHIQPQKPLPQDLAKILEGKQDAIYFSLGTNVRTSELSESQLNKMFQVLGELPYTILWKYDADNLPKNLPKNFHVRKWFPQQDILGHPKIKLFIMQGGLQSLDEALARKVPLLVMPFLGDQRRNAERCVSLGLAESINFRTFTKEELREKLRKLLTDPSYQKNIEKQSKIASDQPMDPLETAIFWIEYVIRHDGANHLHYAAIDLPFYQYYLLDVYLLVAVMLGVLFYVGRKIGVIIVLSIRALRKLVLRVDIKFKSS